MTATPLDLHFADAATVAPTSRRARWAGRIITGFAVAFLTFDVAIKLLRLDSAVDATGQLGFPALLWGGLWLRDARVRGILRAG